jgi:hypothetical protein
MCFVYWIRSPEMTDIKTEGYVGVSNNPKSRFYAHMYHPSNERMRAGFESLQDVVMEIVLNDFFQHGLESMVC